MVLLELRGQLRDTDGQPEELQAQRKIAVTVREKGDERNGTQIESVQKPGGKMNGLSAEAVLQIERGT